jgi:hypothetical protein
MLGVHNPLWVTSISQDEGHEHHHLVNVHGHFELSSNASVVHTRLVWGHPCNCATLGVFHVSLFLSPMPRWGRRRREHVTCVYVWVQHAGALDSYGILWKAIAARYVGRAIQGPRKMCMRYVPPLYPNRWSVFFKFDQESTKIGWFTVPNWS